MKYVVRKGKPIPFSWRFEVEIRSESDTVSLKEFQVRKIMKSHKSSRETQKVFKTALFAQNTRFLRLNQDASKSPGPVARTLKTKILKIFLSVFRDWKFYPQGSREVSCENLCVPLVTRTSTWEHVANLSREKHNSPNFEKYSKYFSWLGHWPTSKSWKISMWAHDWGLQLDQPVTKSP